MKNFNLIHKTTLCLAGLVVGLTATLEASQAAMTTQQSSSSATTATPPAATSQAGLTISAEEQAKIKATAHSNVSSLPFTNSKGEKIEGIIRPAITKTDTVLILSHSLFSHKNSPTFNALAEVLNSRGISIFGFDFYGHGTRGKDAAAVARMSEKEKLNPPIDAKALLELTPSKGVDDLISAITMLKKQGYSKFILMGSSFGGLVSIIVASQLQQDIIGLILKAPLIDVTNGFGGLGSPESWQKTGFINLFVGKLGYCFYDDSRQYNTYELAKKIQCPVLTMHSEKDEFMSLKDSQQFNRNLVHGTLKIMAGANHRSTNALGEQAGAAFDVMIKTSSEFALNVALQAVKQETAALEAIILHNADLIAALLQETSAAHSATKEVAEHKQS